MISQMFGVKDKFYEEVKQDVKEEVGEFEDDLDEEKGLIEAEEGVKTEALDKN